MTATNVPCPDSPAAGQGTRRAELSRADSSVPAPPAVAAAGGATSPSPASSEGNAGPGQTEVGAGNARAYCARCGLNPERVRGWCKRCYNIWYNAGRPDPGPPLPSSQRGAHPRQIAVARRSIRRAIAANQARADGRREDYAWLRNEQGLTIAQAAERMRVSHRTAQRYERALQEVP